MDSEITERKQILKEKKNSLISKIRKLELQTYYKTCEIKAIQTILKGKLRPEVHSLKRKLRVLNFKIETESISLQIERQLMKEIKKTEKELNESITQERQFRKLSYLESDISENTKEISRLEAELQEVNQELASIDKEIREREKQRDIEERIKKNMELREKKRDTHDQLKKENEPYLVKLEPTVSLEDICVIKKREGKKNEE